MSTDYEETQVEESNVEARVLESLAYGGLFVFIVAHLDSEGSISPRVATGGGISDTETIKNLLKKTLEAMP